MYFNQGTYSDAIIRLVNEKWASAVTPIPGGHPHPKWFLNCLLPDFLPHLRGQWIEEAQKHGPGHSVGEPKSQDWDLNTPADLGHPCLPEEGGNTTLNFKGGAPWVACLPNLCEELNTTAL